MTSLYNSNKDFTVGRHGGTVVSSVAPRQEGSWSELWLEPLSVEFACSPWVFTTTLTRISAYRRWMFTVLDYRAQKKICFS